MDAAAETTGAIAGADGGGDLANGADATASPRLAANGVPIPPPALANDSCAFLDVATVACSMDSECAPVTCDCGGNPVVFKGCWDNCVIGCMGKCIAGISCAAACATADPTRSVLACLTKNPFCKSDADCKQTSFPYRCLVPPNAVTGECVTGARGSPCLADADCQSRACVVMAEGLSFCGGGAAAIGAPGGGGGPCNTDDQCSVLATTADGGAGGMGGICAIAPGAFVGSCSAGTNRSSCATQHDCQPSLECAVLAGVRVCTSRREGAPCGRAADCESGFFCVDYACSTAQGPQGHACVTQADCQVPLECAEVNGGNVCTSRGKGAPCASAADCARDFAFCINATCSAGTPGDHCFGDSDCQGFCAAGVCSDGKLGTPCRVDGTGCAAGLRCPPATLICTGP